MLSFYVEVGQFGEKETIGGMGSVAGWSKLMSNGQLTLSMTLLLYKYQRRHEC